MQTSGYVVVFDDISDVISAQRSIAWGEVARRLAHEIKNPLTPIQLSAERLQMKLADKLTPRDADVLKRGATTIVNQVAAMKQMVDNFRDYARTPPAVLAQSAAERTGQRSADACTASKKARARSMSSSRSCR